MPKGLWLVNPKFNFCAMEIVSCLALSEKQIEDLRTIFVNWSNDSEIKEVLSSVCSEKHNDIAKLFLQEVADAIICDVSIMTKEERDKDRMSFYCSMEGLED
jgi:hypothetical protein